ncbi:MAG: hypothetical protein ACRCXZ_10495 [Patescibacteria group bacterium]
MEKTETLYIAVYRGGKEEDDIIDFATFSFEKIEEFVGNKYFQECELGVKCWGFPYIVFSYSVLQKPTSTIFVTCLTRRDYGDLKPLAIFPSREAAKQFIRDNHVENWVDNPSYETINDGTITYELIIEEVEIN